MSTVLTYATGKALEIFEEKFKGIVIQRWTKFRAECFFRSFIDAYSEELSFGKEMVSVDEKLNDILADDLKSELLFDAYRRVAFSASKEIGPKIIGHLTARLVLESRRATEEEEKVFQVAEQMNDGELHGFFKEYSKIKLSIGSARKTIEAKMVGDELMVILGVENYNSSVDFTGSERVVLPLDVDRNYGGWALKLKNYGLLKDSTTEQEQLHQHVDAWTGKSSLLSTARILRVTFTSGCKVLFELIERSYGAASR